MAKETPVLLFDNYDSFTYNLHDYLCQLKAKVLVIRNDELSIEEIKKLSFDAIVLSPGPKRPKDAGILMDLVHQFINKKPILGVCLGHQAIGEYYGHSLTRAIQPMHGKTSSLTHNGNRLFDHISTRFEVMRYHSLILHPLDPSPLEIIAQTKEKEMMAFAHQTLPVFGVQFHPESILSIDGLQMLSNFLQIVRNEKTHEI